MDWQPLIDAARSARQHAYAPYSGFRVGSAIRTSDGRIVVGCNVENRSFGSTVCAERVAVGSAVATGSLEIEALAVISDAKPPAPPCGLCLQVLTEFASQELPVLLLNPDGERREFRLRDLHPHPFQLPDQGLGRRSPGGGS